MQKNKMKNLDRFSFDFDSMTSSSVAHRHRAHSQITCVCVLFGCLNVLHSLIEIEALYRVIWRWQSVETAHIAVVLPGNNSELPSTCTTSIRNVVCAHRRIRWHWRTSHIHHAQALRECKIRMKAHTFVHSHCEMKMNRFVTLCFCVFFLLSSCFTIFYGLLCIFFFIFTVIPYTRIRSHVKVELLFVRTFSSNKIQ